MAANHIVNTSKARHSSSLKITDPLKKITFERLLSNEFTSRSGIYRIMSGNLADIIYCTNNEGKLINADEAKDLVKSLAEKERVLMYDADSHVVYVLNFVEMVPFGLSADLIAKSLLAEYKNYYIKEFWKHFFVNNYDYIMGYLTDSENKSEKSAKYKAKKIKRRIEEIEYIKTTDSMQKLKDLLDQYKNSQLNS